MVENDLAKAEHDKKAMERVAAQKVVTYTVATVITAILTGGLGAPIPALIGMTGAIIIYYYKCILHSLLNIHITYS